MAKLDSDRLLEELQAIKRLLVLALVRGGVTQDQIAKTLQTSQASVSRMLPSGLSVSVANKTIQKKAGRKKR